MLENDGSLKVSSSNLAQQQWQSLKSAYEALGITVDVLKAEETLPDMVFAANQSFVYFDHSTKKSNVVLSNMRHTIRQPETKVFEKWYAENNYIIHKLPSQYENLFFEGNGDALPIVSKKLVLAGYGPRTSEEVYDFLAHKTGYEILKLNPTNPKFYHLDTCLSILNNDTIALVKEVFTSQELSNLDQHFENVIAISPEEAEQNFAANCHCPDGKNVILQKGSNEFCSNLKQQGFNCIEVDTSEFMKSGGSVFCMKMVV